MAIVILCGLKIYTVFNMLVLPVIYLKVTRDGWGVSMPKLTLPRRKLDDIEPDEATA